MKRLDQGSDYYGANFSGTTDISQSNKSITSLGWVGNWNYTAKGVHSDEAATSGYLSTLGSYSSARTLTLDNNMTIKQSVIDPSAATTRKYADVTKTHTVRGANAAWSGQWVDREDANWGSVYGLYDVANTNVSQTYTLNFTSTKGNYTGRIYIDIWQGGDYVRFNYDPSNGLYNVKSRSGELDKGLEGQVSSSYYYDGILGNGNGYSADSGLKNWKVAQLKVITDKTSVEFIFPNGQTYTIARYSNSEKQDFKIFTQDPNSANKVTVTVSDNVQNVVK